ncbi:MAG: hypothetical protein JSU08_15270 [Acidobacteria bacterium]|nr:hypothetical protein [Acidobacteriota bacterium]
MLNIDAERRVVAPCIDRLTQVLADLDRRPAEVQRDYAAGRLTPMQHDGAMGQYQRDRRAVIEGVLDGVNAEIAAAVRGTGGLRKQQRRLEQLNDEYERLQKVATLDPDGRYRRRFKGGGNCTFDGRVLQPGEVVDLSANQVLHWADMFEVVS